MQKNETRSYLTPYTDINLKWFKNLHIRRETIRYIEENISIKFRDLGHRRVFVNLTQKTMEVTAEISKWDYIKLEFLHRKKKKINKTKGQPTKQEKIFTNTNTCKYFTTTA